MTVSKMIYSDAYEDTAFDLVVDLKKSNAAQVNNFTVVEVRRSGAVLRRTGQLYSFHYGPADGLDDVRCV